MYTPEEFKRTLPITIGGILFIISITAVLTSYYWKFDNAHKEQTVIEQRMDKRYERQQEINKEFEKRLHNLENDHSPH